MIGAHVIKWWSAEQASVALSSGEAELHGVVRAAAAALGHRSIMNDLGLKTRVRVWTDSSAAIGTCSRQGLGKMRHVGCHALLVQQRIWQGELEQQGL